jgi:hypothetical protein
VVSGGENVPIPPGLTPKRVCPISGDMVLLLPEASTQPILYADFQAGPVKLAIPALDWPAVVDLYPGRGAWVAAAAEDKTLSMWRLLRTGHLVPYLDKNEQRQTYPIGPIASFATTMDGRYLVGITHDTIATWRFPVLSAETFSRGSGR